MLGSRLIVLDEPTAHQDEKSRQRVLDAMLDAAWMGSAVIAASHDAAVHDAAHRHLQMVDGELAE